MYFTYILQSQKNGKYYIGHTADIAKRLESHNRGSNYSTKPGRPWKLVYNEEFSDKKSAMKREKIIKSYKGGDSFKSLLNNL
jgi:putative endonuclease